MEETAIRILGILRWHCYLAIDAYPTKLDRIMRNCSTLALFLFVLLVLAPPRTAFAQDQYVQQVLDQLEAASAEFISAGYTPIMGDGGVLDHEASDTYTVTLQTGRSYTLMGVCDEDCPDLDLELYDGYGELVSRDNSTDAYPIVDVSVAQGGDFTLRVTMYQCNANPCYYGVGVYRE